MTIIREERIGGQRLILGDCRYVESELSYDVVATDPPYGMNFQSNYRKEKHSRIENDKGVELLLWACSLRPKHSSYIWMRWDNLFDVPKPRSLITWVKNNHSMGDLEHEHGRKTEVAAFYPGPDHKWGKGRPTDVIYCPRTGNDHHPTEKPVELMRSVIEWTIGDVFDPFMGSGTTLVAAEKIGRRGVGCEVSPEHFKTACERVHKAWQSPDMFAKQAAATHEQEALF